MIFLLKSNVRVVSWRWCSLWATNIHEFLLFLSYDAAAGYLGVVRKEHPLHLPQQKPFRTARHFEKETHWTNIPPLSCLSRDTSPLPCRNYFHGFKQILYISAPVSLVPTTNRRSPHQVYSACPHYHEHVVASTSRQTCH